MKKLLALITLLSLTVGLYACSLSSGFADDLLNAKQEATEAIENLTTEATDAYEAVETKVDQFNQAAESVSNALDAVKQAKDDIGTFTGGEEDDANPEESAAE